MSKKRQYKSYSAEFKQKAVGLVTEQETRRKKKRWGSAGFFLKEELLRFIDVPSRRYRHVHWF